MHRLSCSLASNAMALAARGAIFSSIIRRRQKRHPAAARNAAARPAQS